MLMMKTVLTESMSYKPAWNIFGSSTMDVKAFLWNISLSQLRDLVIKSVVLNRLQLTVCLLLRY